jgi:hypothetical protein
MAKQIINTGKSQNKGDGDPLRTAFTKVNENFNSCQARKHETTRSSHSSNVSKNVQKPIFLESYLLFAEYKL